MIKIENVDVFGFEAAIRGMRNPMNSWDKSDSGYCCGDKKCSVMEGCDLACDIPHFVVRKNDLKLMKTLSKAGNDHGKFLRMINVTLDITAPLYWWKEFDTYKVGTVGNSCSTMHKIHEKEFTLDDFSHEHLWNVDHEMIDYILARPDEVLMIDTPLDILKKTVATLNYYRDEYLRIKSKPMKDESKRAELMKKCWWQMIQLLPSSYNQKRTVQLNYQVLKTMYYARRNHKLDEWREFCKWCETLPYFKEICLDE